MAACYCENQAVNAILSYYAQIAEKPELLWRSRHRWKRKYRSRNRNSACFWEIYWKTRWTHVGKTMKAARSRSTSARPAPPSLPSSQWTILAGSRQLFEGKRFLSTKHSGPGIGTQSIRSSLNGTVEMRVLNGRTECSTHQ